MSRPRKVQAKYNRDIMYMERALQGQAIRMRNDEYIRKNIPEGQLVKIKIYMSGLIGGGYIEDVYKCVKQYKNFILFQNQRNGLHVTYEYHDLWCALGARTMRIESGYEGNQFILNILKEDACYV